MKRLAFVVLLILLLNYLVVSAQQNERRYPWQSFGQESRAAYRNKDYPAF